MRQKLIYSRTSVYNINYHIVWSVKYRRKVLTPAIAKFLQEEAVKIGAEKGFVVHLFNVGELDHVHTFVSAAPKVSISYIVKMLKGILGRRVFMEFPELRETLRHGVIWNHSFYVETVGSVSEENVRQYIEKQTNAY